jgi:hypothetical protein
MRLPKPLTFAAYALVCGIATIIILLEQGFMSKGQERVLVWQAEECRLGATKVNYSNDDVDAYALCPNREPFQIEVGSRELLNSLLVTEFKDTPATVDKKFFCFAEHLVWSDRTDITCAVKPYEEVLTERAKDD